MLVSKKFQIPAYLFLIFCLSVIAAPLTQATTENTLSKGQAYALALLGLVVLSLFIYLFVVIFQPEKF
jgi:K+-transporting ATPase KdpF subunit